MSRTSNVAPSQEGDSFDPATLNGRVGAFPHIGRAERMSEQHLATLAFILSCRLQRTIIRRCQWPRVGSCDKNHPPH